MWTAASHIDWFLRLLPLFAASFPLLAVPAASLVVWFLRLLSLLATSFAAFL